MNQEVLEVDSDVVNLSAYADSLHENLKVFEQLARSQKSITDLEIKFNTDNLCYKEPLNKINEILELKNEKDENEKPGFSSDAERENFLEYLKDLKSIVNSEIINEFDKPKNINFLLKDALNNIDNLRDESLYLLYKLQNVDLDIQEKNDIEKKSKCNLKSLKLSKNNKYRVTQLEYNVLRKDYIENFLENYENQNNLNTENKPKFTVEVKVYGSIKRSLFHRFILRSDNTLLDLANTILCVSSKIESSNYSSFFYLEDEIYVDNINKISSID